MTYLILIGSLIGFTTYAWLLRVAPLPRISTYAYVNPVVAVFLGALILAEPITIRTLVASAVILVGVVLIVTGRGSASTQPTRNRHQRRPIASRPPSRRRVPGSSGSAPSRRQVEPRPRRPPHDVSRARTPARATARSGAADPGGSPARSRPGSACGAG